MPRVFEITSPIIKDTFGDIVYTTHDIEAIYLPWRLHTGLNKITIDLSSFSGGINLLKASGENQYEIKRIIIK